MEYLSSSFLYLDMKKPILLILFITFSLFSNAQENLIFSLINKGYYPFEATPIFYNIDSSNEYVSFCKSSAWKKCNKGLVKDTSQIRVPNLYTAYLYPRLHLNKYGRWSFTVVNVIKNHSKDFWNVNQHTESIVISKSKRIVLQKLFNPSFKKPREEGWLSYTANDLEFDEWSPLNPYIYDLKVISFVDSTLTGIAQNFECKVGFREVEFVNDELVLNHSNIRKTATGICSENINKLDITSIRKNHFNTIVASDLISKEALAICDSIGLMVIQNLGPRNIQDTTNFLINYFDQYTHPSLIAWNVSDSPELGKILSELDPKRPIIDLKADYQKWNELDSVERIRIMHRQQPYSFWFDRQKGIVKPLKNNDFYDLEMKIKWSVLKDGVSIETGQSQFDETLETKIESLQNLDPSLGLIISLKAAEDKLHYQQGDLISWDEFYFLEKGDYVETRKKIF